MSHLNTGLSINRNSVSKLHFLMVSFFAVAQWLCCKTTDFFHLVLHSYSGVAPVSESSFYEHSDLLVFYVCFYFSPHLTRLIKAAQGQNSTCLKYFPEKYDVGEHAAGFKITRSKQMVLWAAWLSYVLLCVPSVPNHTVTVLFLRSSGPTSLS